MSKKILGADNMSLEERLIQISKNMSEEMLIQVIDFAEYIKDKKGKEQRDLVDEFITENEIALKELSK